MSARFQFARIKTYSAQPNKLATGEGGKAWSIADVEGEASRNELHCSHVLRPMSAAAYRSVDQCIQRRQLDKFWIIRRFIGDQGVKITASVCLPDII
jgi:hypothetical protein